MEEEVTYSTVTFKTFPPPPKDKEEEPVIYSEVKVKASAAIVPDGEAAARAHLRVLAACLGILCVLLVASISAIIYIHGVMTEEKTNLSNLKAESQQLITEKSILEKETEELNRVIQQLITEKSIVERETEELNRVTDNLNWTLGVILKFSTFPVTEYCPEKKCQPCKKDWIPFQEKCYLFYEKGYAWKSWENSRRYCQSETADLVVIDSLQEQEFISNHTKYYYDRFHGYWIGLSRTGNKNWVWIDGQIDTLSYWTSRSFGDSDSFVLMMPGLDPTASWSRAESRMFNKFICESDALIRSN